MTSNNINIQLKRSHLYVHLTGKFCLESMKQQVEKMLQTCTKHHYRKILVNATKIEGLLSVLDRYLLGAYIDTMWNREIRIAFIVSEREYFEHKFFETVVRNRGILIETFVNAKAAHKWLASNEHMQ